MYLDYPSLNRRERNKKKEKIKKRKKIVIQMSYVNTFFSNDFSVPSNRGCWLKSRVLTYSVTRE